MIGPDGVIEFARAGQLEPVSASVGDEDIPERGTPLADVPGANVYGLARIVLIVIVHGVVAPDDRRLEDLGVCRLAAR